MTTAADILGSPRKPPIQSRWAKHHQALCRERDRLLARDRSTPETSRARVDDLGEAASEDVQTSLALVSASASQGILAEIIDAIERIERATFGICEISGEPIEAERLDAIPWARYSFEGQRRLEAECLAKTSAFAPLKSLAEHGEADSKERDEAE